MRRLRLMLATALLLGSARALAAPAAESADPARLSRLADYARRLEAFGFSGQLLVAERGQVVFERSCGRADRRHAQAMTAETRLAVGSVTKSFVAAAVLSLESQGKLALSDRLGDRLEGVPEEMAGITLEQLLCHRGGFAFDIPDGLAIASRDEVVSAVLAQPLQSEPGERFAYSNAGFDLLAAVVERATGEGLDAYLRRTLLPRADITASGLAGASALPEGPSAVGHGPWGEVSWWPEWPRGWSGTGSGRMVMTARDLWRWGEGLRSGRVLGAEGWARMRAEHARVSPERGYALGLWRIEREEWGPVLQIGGDVEGYRAECRILEEEDRVIVVLTNRDSEDGGLERESISTTLAQLARGAEPRLPPPVAALGGTHAPSPEGVWRLEGSSRLEFWREAGQMLLALRGQEAVELFEPSGEAARSARRAAQRTAEVLLRAALLEDSTLARTVLTGDEFARVFPFLRSRLRVLRAMHAPLLEVNGLGVRSDPADARVLTGHVALRFERRTEALELTWREGVLEGVTFAPERPGARILAVAPLAEGGFAAWDPSRAMATRFRIEPPAGAPERLVVVTPSGEVSAVRAR